MTAFCVEKLGRLPQEIDLPVADLITSWAFWLESETMRNAQVKQFVEGNP